MFLNFFLLKTCSECMVLAEEEFGLVESVCLRCFRDYANIMGCNADRDKFSLGRCLSISILINFFPVY